MPRLMFTILGIPEIRQRHQNLRMAHVMLTTSIWG